MKLLVALGGLLLLVSCQQNEEYVVRDLTTYKSAWNWERHEIDSAAPYAFSNFRVEEFESRFIIPDDIQRLNQIKKDTQTIALYMRPIYGLDDYPVQACVISIGIGEDSGECQFRFISESEKYRYSIEKPRKSDDFIWRVKLQNGVSRSLINELEEWQIWQRHSFLEEKSGTHDNPAFLEIRDGDRYKLLTCTAEAYYLLLQMLNRTGVNDYYLNALLESIRREDNTFHIDSIPDLSHDRRAGRTIYNIEQGYFDIDSTWLVE